MTARSLGAALVLLPALAFAQTEPIVGLWELERFEDARMVVEVGRDTVWLDGAPSPEVAPEDFRERWLFRADNSGRKPFEGEPTPMNWKVQGDTLRLETLGLVDLLRWQWLPPGEERGERLVLQWRDEGLPVKMVLRPVTGQGEAEAGSAPATEEGMTAPPDSAGAGAADP